MRHFSLVGYFRLIVPPLCKLLLSATLVNVATVWFSVKKILIDGTCTIRLVDDFT